MNEFYLEEIDNLKKLYEKNSNYVKEIDRRINILENNTISSKIMRTLLIFSFILPISFLSFYSLSAFDITSLLFSSTMTSIVIGTVLGTYFAKKEKRKMNQFTSIKTNSGIKDEIFVEREKKEEIKLKNKVIECTINELQNKENDLDFTNRFESKTSLEDKFNEKMTTINSIARKKVIVDEKNKIYDRLNDISGYSMIIGFIASLFISFPIAANIISSKTFIDIISAIGVILSSFIPVSVISNIVLQRYNNKKVELIDKLNNGCEDDINDLTSESSMILFELVKKKVEEKEDTALYSLISEYEKENDVNKFSQNTVFSESNYDGLFDTNKEKGRSKVKKM